MRNIKHLTPKYILNRLQYWLYEKKNPNNPWLTPSMIDILTDCIKPTDVGFEWGSGRSTLWLAKKMKHLTSIEEDPSWSEFVSQGIKSQLLTDKVSYILHGNVNGMPLQSYVDVIDDFDEESLDFCLIDGNLRDICALKVIPKLRTGGVLVIDNIERYLPRAIPSCSPNSRTLEDGYASEIWECFSQEIEGWRCIWTSNGVSDTALWIKLNNS